MADGSIVFETALDNKTLEKDLAKLRRRIQTLNNQIFVKEQQKIPLVEQSKKLAANLDEAKAKLFEMQSGKQFYTGEHIAAQAEQVKNLQKEWDKAQNAVEQYDAAIQKTNIELNATKERAGTIQQTIATSSVDSEKMEKATSKAAVGAGKFARQIKYALSSIVLFSIAFQAFSAFSSWLATTITANNEAATAIGRLKGALLTLAQPIMNVIIPAFTAFVNILADVINAIARVVSFLFGTTAKESAKQAASGLKEEQDAIDGVGSSAKKAEKQLASFDEINKLAGDTSSGGTGGGGVGGGALDGISPIFEDFDSAAYKEKLDVITAYVSGALLALGAILAFSGANIPLGIALMAAGAIGLASVIAMNWNAMPESVQTALTQVFTVLGTAAMVIGAILAFSGANIPLGIGLMIAGAAALGTAVAINWGSMTKEIKSTVVAAMEILGAAALVVGAILCFTGASVPLGVALMALGAASLASAAYLNWKYLSQNIKSVATEITLIMGASLLALGAILALSGVNLPLGIALMVAGAASLAAAAAINWDYIAGNLRGQMGVVTAIASAALLALGVILCFTGVGIPLGVALIAAGAAGLVTVTAINWDAILEKLKGVWNGITTWWDSNVAEYLTVEHWKNVGSDILNGFLDGLKNAWTGIKDWVSEKADWISSAFSSAKNTVSSIVSSATGGTRAATYSAQNLSLPSIPKLATGGVIPPNREFLAVLGDQKSGTNIETPLSTMVQAFRQAMSDMGYGGQGEAVLEVDGQQFGRLVYKYNNKETRRIGTKLVEA